MVTTLEGLRHHQLPLTMMMMMRKLSRSTLALQRLFPILTQSSKYPIFVRRQGLIVRA